MCIVHSCDVSWTWEYVSVSNIETICFLVLETNAPLADSIHIVMCGESESAAGVTATIDVL